MAYIINKSEFKLDHVNDPAFLANLGDFNSHILGSVMNVVRASFEIDVFWETRSTVSLNMVLLVSQNTSISKLGVPYL